MSRASGSKNTVASANAATAVPASTATFIASGNSVDCPNARRTSSTMCVTGFTDANSASGRGSRAAG